MAWQKIFLSLALLIFLGGINLSAKELTFNQLIELKKGEKIEIQDKEENKTLAVEFLGAGYEEGRDDSHSSHAIFKLNYGKYENSHFFMESVKGKPGKKRFENFLFILEFSNGINLCKIKVIKQYPWVVVFKKETDRKKAEKIIQNELVEYIEGMDSSRGKIYFKETGPKFILFFKEQKSKNDFYKKYSSHGWIYEIYEPNWHIHKD